MTSSVSFKESSSQYSAIFTAQPALVTEKRESDYGQAENMYKSGLPGRKQELEQQAASMQKRIEEHHLHSLLRENMKEIHKEAKQNTFLNDLINGNMVCSKAYVVYLCNLFWLHSALEVAQRQILTRYGEGFFVFPLLYRSERLLADIKLWSFVNSTAPKFADQDLHSTEFLENVKHFVQPCTFECVAEMEALTREDPILIIGFLFALYGTILSGGQFVKDGVKKAFLDRLHTAIAEYQEDEAKKSKVESATIHVVDEEDTALKAEIMQKVIEDEKEIERYAAESVSFFSFDPDFEIPIFKQKWHCSLDQIPEQLHLDVEARKQFEKKMISGCEAGIRIVLNLIASLEENLKKGVI